MKPFNFYLDSFDPFGGLSVRVRTCASAPVDSYLSQANGAFIFFPGCEQKRKRQNEDLQSESLPLHHSKYT